MTPSLDSTISPARSSPAVAGLFDESMTFARLYDTVAIRIPRPPGPGALDERTLDLADLNEVED